MKGKLIVICGTNASGKSGLGVEMASRFNGEVVSADSRQVFERLDLGSGKITKEEMQGVPHHLIDVCKPGDFFSMADFQRLSYAAIDDILARQKVPFLVGGTGLYVNAVADGYELSDRAPDLELRARLETFETPKLYEMLKEQLPDTDIDPRNRNRVMRALERLAADDYHPGKRSPRYETLKIGVSWDTPGGRGRRPGPDRRAGSGAEAALFSGRLLLLQGRDRPGPAGPKAGSMAAGVRRHRQPVPAAGPGRRPGSVRRVPGPAHDPAAAAGWLYGGDPQDQEILRQRQGFL